MVRMTNEPLDDADLEALRSLWTRVMNGDGDPEALSILESTVGLDALLGQGEEPTPGG